MPLPQRLLLDGNAVARGGEDVAAADGDQLAAVIAARHVVQDGRVVDEGVQLPVGCNGEVTEEELGLSAAESAHCRSLTASLFLRLLVARLPVLGSPDARPGSRQNPASLVHTLPRR